MRRRALLRSLSLTPAVAAGCLTAPRAEPPAVPPAADAVESDGTLSLSASADAVAVGDAVTFTLSNRTDDRVAVGGDAWTVWRLDGDRWSTAAVREDFTLDLLLVGPHGEASWTLRPTAGGDGAAGSGDRGDAEGSGDAEPRTLGEGEPPRDVPLAPGRYWFLKDVAGEDGTRRYAVAFEVVGD